jgi:hypothetical protein
VANLDDLGIKSISDMTVDEGLEHLRLIRLSRRTPVRSQVTKVTQPKKPKVDIGSMSQKDKEELLKILTGG